MTHDPVDNKIVIMGDSAVGKTSLALNYLGKGFADQYIPTLGANFSTKLYQRDEHNIRVMIIDVAGQDNFHLLRERYFVGASGVLLVFDVTRPFDPTDQIKPWVKEVLDYTNNRGVPIAILANKVDLMLLRHTEPFNGINAAIEAKEMMNNNVPVAYFETSAKFGIEVENAFDWLIESIIAEATI